jgi:hypothetical protein
MDAVVRSVIDESDGRSVDVVELLAELSVLKTSELVEVVLGPWPPTRMPATMPCLPDVKLCGVSLR